MKKGFIFLIIVVIIVAIVGYRYISYKNEYNTIQKENSDFDRYKDQIVYGLDVASMMNKAVDKNTKNKISKDEQGYFVQNDENSIEIEIYMLDNQTTYKMETIYNSGTEQFVQYYGEIQFKCSKIEYHKKTGRINSIFFEQQENS